eukprot:1812479-Rhodomonas_salina.1
MVPSLTALRVCYAVSGTEIRAAIRLLFDLVGSLPLDLIFFIMNLVSSAQLAMHRLRRVRY